MKALYFFFILLLYSCGSPSGNSGMDMDPETMKRGETLYRTHCSACHRANGEGFAGMYPPLAGTDWVTGDKSRLIAIALNGMQGPIEVNGISYNQVMIPHSFLNDQQLADVLTYIRNSFGNRAGTVHPSEVKKLRSGH